MHSRWLNYCTSIQVMLRPSCTETGRIQLIHPKILKVSMIILISTLRISKRWQWITRRPQTNCKGSPKNPKEYQRVGASGAPNPWKWIQSPAKSQTRTQCNQNDGNFECRTRSYAHLNHVHKFTRAQVTNASWLEAWTRTRTQLIGSFVTYTHD